MKKRLFNGEGYDITVVTDLGDIVIPERTIMEVEIPEGVQFNSDSFYIQEDGLWYIKTENCFTGADMEIYSE